MEIRIVPNSAGKYSVSDLNNKTLYSVKNRRKSFTTFITTYLYDTNGYMLYSLQKTADGNKPAFEMILNDEQFMRIQCKSIFVEPCIQFNGKKDEYVLKGQDRTMFTLYKNGDSIGELKTEIQLNDLPQYRLTIDDKHFDDFIVLFAVVVDMCFRVET